MGRVWSEHVSRLKAKMKHWEYTQTSNKSIPDEYEGVLSVELNSVPEHMNLDTGAAEKFWTAT